MGNYNCNQWLHVCHYAAAATTADAAAATGRSQLVTKVRHNQIKTLTTFRADEQAARLTGTQRGTHRH